MSKIYMFWAIVAKYHYLIQQMFHFSSWSILIWAWERVGVQYQNWSQIIKIDIAE